MTNQVILLSNKNILLICALVTVLACVVDLIGWTTQDMALVRLVPSLPAMSAVTAAIFLLCSVAILALKAGTSSRRVMVITIASIVIVSGLTDVVMFLLSPAVHASLQAAAKPTPKAINLMSPNTALTFCVFGASLLLMNVRSRRTEGGYSNYPYQVAAFAVMVNGAVAILGQISGVTYLYAVQHFIGMAPQTAILFIVIAAAVLLAQPDRGFVNILLSSGIAGKTARSFIIVLLILPVLVGIVAVLTSHLQSGSLYFIVVASIIALVSVVASIITRLHEQVELARTYADEIAQLEREKIELTLKSTQDELRLTVSNAQRREQAFLRDMLRGVTDGRLLLCLSQEDLPPPLKPVGETIPLSLSNSGIREIRHFVGELCEVAQYAADRCYDIQTAVSEAAMNAVVHAGEGFGQVFINDAGTIQVRISDSGHGIEFESLPDATLQRGFTTAGTMGHGMKIMLQTVDRIFLLTSSTGTTVVMEQDKEAPDPPWF